MSQENLREAVKPEIRVPVIWVIGGPGSGKGTQCHKIVGTYGFCHISVGELLRRESQVRSQKGTNILKIIQKGKLVSTNIVLNLIKDEMHKNLDTAKGFLIDGFPRIKEQGVVFEKTVTPVNLILFLDAPEDVLIKRILQRGNFSGRVDDNEKSIQYRLQTHIDLKDGICQEFKDKIKLIDANRLPDDIFADIQSHLESLCE